MILVFTSVNSEKIERHTFDGYDFNKVEDCIKVYKEIEKVMTEESLEWYAYDMSNPISAYNFAFDYNDELLDGGYWCFALSAINFNMI